MTLVRDAGAKLIAQFPVPYKGTWKSVAVNQLSADSLYDSNNVFIRKGKLRERPGLTLLNSSLFDAPVLGGAMAVTPTDKVLLAVTKGKLYTLKSTDTSWQTDTTTTFAANDNSVVDITFLETASQYVAVFAASGQLLKRWIQGSGAATVTAVTGTVPTAISVCTTARRIVALIDPHTVVWSTTLTYDNWTALAIARLAQTNDKGICVRTLSNLSFVVYKERSIYLARAQSGSDAFAFGFTEPIIVEGPAGLHAVVTANSTHFYMTTNGRIALFNGTGYPQWIADGLWLYLQSDIDPAYTSKIFGVFDYRLNLIIFYYPRNGDSGQLKGAVIINLPLEGSGVTTFSFFLAQFEKAVSYGYEMRFNNTIDKTVLFTAVNPQSVNLDEAATQDIDTNFNASFQTSLQPLPDMLHYYTSIESFLERANGNGSVKVYPVVSDTLENETGTVVTDDNIVIDLNFNPIREYVGFTARTRFFGLKYEWVSGSKVRYAGTQVYGRPVA